MQKSCLLEQIETCPYSRPDLWWSLIKDCWAHDFGSNWQLYDMIRSWQENPLEELILTTGGHSDNEEIIEIMSRNYSLWSRYWKSSCRGGKHFFNDSQPFCILGRNCRSI